MARAHGEDVQVRSEPGAGSTFTLVLPGLLVAWPDAAPHGDEVR